MGPGPSRWRGDVPALNLVRADSQPFGDLGKVIWTNFSATIFTPVPQGGFGNPRVLGECDECETAVRDALP